MSTRVLIENAIVRIDKEIEREQYQIREWQSEINRSNKAIESLEELKKVYRSDLERLNG